ncbi:hypothetical protein BJ912DRAFT_665292 [Pholiota molesta]|nr:hypothetical protein BJ912DRAFT_665292 [Pholiota molesta]
MYHKTFVIIPAQMVLWPGIPCWVAILAVSCSLGARAYARQEVSKELMFGGAHFVNEFTASLLEREGEEHVRGRNMVVSGKECMCQLVERDFETTRGILSFVT